VTFTVPVAPTTDYDGASITPILSCVSYRDASANATLLGVIQWTTGSTFRLVSYSVSGATITPAGLSSTAPFTWATTDTIEIAGSYEAA